MSKATERDALIKLIHDAAFWDENGLDANTPESELEIAEAVIEAGYTKPRTITTVEELDALPKWAVVLSDEIAYQRGYDYWDGLGRGWESQQIDLPAVVIYTPTGEAGN